MPTTSYQQGHLSIWRGNDVLPFIDGLSTNHVLDLQHGEFRQTTFTTAQAKVIDRVGLFHMGGFIAVLSHGPFWEQLARHITPRILNQDVSISNATENNQFFIQYDEVGPEPGHFMSQEGITTARTPQGFNFLVVSKGTEIATDSEVEEFHAWRIENIVPWPEFEITLKHHAFTCGLDEDVHSDKGCYIGQEVLTRMRTRGRKGRVMTKVSNTDVDEASITTAGEIHSLAIIRV
jgi:folate-binding protein YgfZ|tara:strand:+ start:12375 stop:13076 length:702 start_codon:yes stop_codon:yes gene_type:complete